MNPFDQFDEPASQPASKANPFDQFDQPEPQEPETKNSFLGNAARAMGERAADIGGGLLQAAGQAGDYLEEKIPVGGFVFEEGKTLPRYAGADEYKQLGQSGVKDLVQAGADAAKNTSLGYVPEHTWETVKDKFSKGEIPGGMGEVLAYGFETGIQSIPDMVGAVVNLPAYVMARSSEIGDERAKNKGKASSDIVDTLEAAPFALGSALLERLPVKFAFGESADDIGKEAMKAGMAKMAASTAGKEAATEAFQEGVIEYVGERYGTDAQMKVGEMFDRAAGAAVAGGVYGGAMGAAGSLMPKSTEQVSDEIDGAEADLEIDRETDEEWRKLRSELGLLNEVLSLGHNPDPLVVMPDGTTGYQSDLDQLRAQQREQEISGRHPAYPRDVPEPNPNERPLPPINQDGTIDFQPTEVPQAPESQPSPEYEGAIEWAPPPWEQPKQDESGLSLEPMEDNDFSTPHVYDNGIAFMDEAAMDDALNKAWDSNTGAPVDTATRDALAQPIEDAIRQRVESARNERLPEGLKDARLLRGEFQDHLRAMSDDLVKGGGVGYVFNEHGTITGRTPSLNPMWFQELGESMSVVNVQKAVDKALNGEKLGVRQARVVGAMLDEISEQRGEAAAQLRFERQQAIDLKRKQEPTWEEFVAQRQEEMSAAVMADRAGEVFDELSYEPETGYIDRSVAELAQMAVDAGVDRQVVDRIVENPDAETVLSSLQQEIFRTRNDHREATETTATRPGDSEGTAEAVAGEETDAAPALETYTEEELRARQEAQSQRANADREADRKADIDAEASTFNLTGSDLPADQAAAAGQKSLFDRQASEAATSPANTLPEPTEAQIEAGNYKKGHLKVQGLDISIENPRGSKRSGTDPNGKAWETEMRDHYGYIKRSEGADGEHVDVFVGPNPDSQQVFVIDQVNPDGTFDEHKVVMGYDSKLKARAGYLANYSKGWKVGPITGMTTDEFKAWLKDGDTKRPINKDHFRDATKKVDQSENDLNMVEGLTAKDSLTVGGSDPVQPPKDWANSLLKTRKLANQLIEAGELNQEQARAAWSEKGTLAAMTLRALQAHKGKQSSGQSAQTALDEIKNISMTDLDSLMDDVTEEVNAVETSKPVKKRSAKSKTKTGKPRLKPKVAKAEKTDTQNAEDVERTAAEIAKSMGANLNDAGMNALSGLTKLFGGNGRANSGLSFDEDTYAKAKPHFTQALKSTIEAGKDLRDLVRALFNQFGDGIRPYVKRFAQDVQSGDIVIEEQTGGDNAPGSAANLEQGGQDRSGQTTAETVESADESGRGRGRPDDTGARVQADGRRGDRGQDSAGVQGGSAATGGQRGNIRPDQPRRRAEPETGDARGDIGQRSSDLGNDGVSVEPASTEAVEKASDGNSAASLAEKRELQTQAESIPVKRGSIQNIRQTLPYLMREQQDDVLKTEQRFAKPDGYGMLFTNGTGTGKTFSGMGVIKRYVKEGKDNVLIVVPDNKVASDWISSGEPMGVSVTQLASTQDAGKGVTIATYANIGANRELATRQWDLVVADEAHNLMRSADATPTRALKAVRALTYHPDGFRQHSEMLYGDLHDAIKANNAKIASNIKIINLDDTMDQMVAALRKENEALQRQLDKDSAELARKEETLKTKFGATQGAARPRLLALTATPFSYVETIDWANGYLFDYNEGRSQDGHSGRSYNEGNNRDQFFIQNFGYRMRYNRLTKPDRDVNVGLMERNFNTRLRQSGALSGRTISVDHDYDRRFTLIESRIGQRIDEALDWLRDQRGSKTLTDDDRQAYSALEETIAEQFDYLSRRYLLEAIKAQAAIPIIKKHLARGRKVVVFHDYIKGGGFNPFIVRLSSDGPVAERLAYDNFKREFSDLFTAGLESMPSPVDLFRSQIPETLVVNGRESKREILNRYRTFQSDESGPQVILVQSAKNAGWSGHDTTGKHQRVLLNLGLPTTPASSIQQEGRIYRVGQASNAIQRYMNTGTSWERSAFAQTIASRAGTVENLAMGEQARALRESFIRAFEEADNYPPGHEGEGTGGKAADIELGNIITPYDAAKSYYFANQKKTQSNKAKEGKDYFATPEPVGLKMVEWLGLRPGESSLEPSAGHGAIARWLPEDTRRTFVEPSRELTSRLQLVATSDTDKVVNSTFEELHVVNKFDGIAMNPPFGSGGKLAAEHVQKAMKHLRDGGRIVALVPDGPAADKRFNALFESDDFAGFHHIADVRLPSSTFERAGTKVSTRIMVIEKQENTDLAAQLPSRARTIDMRDATSINGLFDRLEDVAMSERLQAPREKPAAASAAIESKGDFKSWNATHSKTKETLYMAKPTGNLDRETYNQVSGKAKDHGGFWDRYTKGFRFESDENRQAFLADVASGQSEGSGVREHGELYSTYERDTRQVQASKKSGETAPLQGDLFAPTNISNAKTARTQSKDNFNVRYEQVPFREVAVGLTHVRTPEEAAHVFAPVRKQGQENFLVLVTDKNDKIINLIQHTKGLKDSANVSPVEVVGAIASTPGAANVWFSHNHPSGTTTPSRADLEVTKQLVESMSGMDLSFQGHIIVSPGSLGANHFMGNGSDSVIKIKPAPRRKTVSVTERVLRKRDKTLARVTSPTEAQGVVASVEASDAVLLLDNAHNLVGTLALSPSEMKALREGGRVRRILSGADKANANAVIIKTNDEDAATNVARFFNRHNIRVLDWFSKTSEGSGQYSGYAGTVSPSRSILSDNGPFYSIASDSKKPKGITLDQLQKVTTEFFDRFPGASKGISVRLFGVEERAFGPNLSERDRGKIKGGFNPATGELVLIAANLDSVADALETLQHEILAHHGMGFLSEKQTAEALSTIRKAILEDPQVSKIWQEVEKTYSDKPIADQLEEVLARVAEQLNTGQWARAWNNVLLAIRKALAKLGLVKPLTRLEDLKSILHGFAKAFEEGGQPGRRDGGVRQSRSTSVDQTETAAFKRWFGNSKVVDAEGKPLVVYHGSPDVRGVFAEGFRSLTRGNVFFAAADYAVADSYADDRRAFDYQNAEPQTVPLYLSIQNPMIVDAKGANWKSTEARVQEAKDAGHDGIIIKNSVDYYNNPPKSGKTTTVYAWFNPSQAKSAVSDQLRSRVDGEPIPGATGNTGAFDPNNPDIRFNRRPDQEPRPSAGVSASETAAEEATLDKLGLAPKSKKRLLKKIADLKTADIKRVANDLRARSYEGTFDGLIGLKRAEDAVGAGIAAGDYSGSGYVGARLATGVSDVMHHILNYGAVKWSGGVLQPVEGTRGILDIMSDLGDDMTDWLAWMGGNRALELMKQGRENNLTQEDIVHLRLRARGKEQKFQKAKQEYNKLNKAMLDMAEGAGLIKPESRKDWESEWYIPFYRRSESDGNATLLGPRTNRGLSHQSSGIKALRGGKLKTNDLLENILSNWVKLADSGMKNSALLKAVDNLKGSDFVADETLHWSKVSVPRREVVKRIKADRSYLEFWAESMGLDRTANELEVAHELNKLSTEGFEEMWHMVAPTDPDVIRVQRDGKNEYYRVADPALLRAVSHLGFNGFTDPVTKTGRWFKRLLTTGVTASPDFMLRNFVRDAVHAWAINPDGFKLARSSLSGLYAAAKQDDDYKALIAGGAAFQGGYVHGSDPDATAQMIRRATLKKGLKEIDHDSVLDTPEKLWNGIQRGWQAYRNAGDRIENANRLATFKAALKAGKPTAQAIFESKDLMDYSLRGNLQALMWLTDMVPFLNARIQGLGKLGRAAVENPKGVGMKVGMLVGFSLFLASLNDDDERYDELPDWEKDAYWHVFIGDEHFRIPKPFEIGIIGGTIPERIWHTMVGEQENEKLVWSLKHNFWGTLGFNPVPQAVMPMMEVWGNRSFYFDTPIEGMADEGKLPQARYNGRTSDTAVAVGQWLKMSPKKLEHIWNGYLGTMGSYALSASDMAVRAFSDRPSKPAWEISQAPVVKSFYRGDQSYSTQYLTDYYDMMEESEQVYRTVKAYREEGRGDDAYDLVEKNRDLLVSRKHLLKVRRQLGGIRKKMVYIERSDMSPEEKRRKLDNLIKIRNDYVRDTIKTLKSSAQ